MRAKTIGLVLSLAACGGQLAPVDDSGAPGNDAGVGKDASQGAFCPTSPPPSGGACSPLNIYCEYGPNPDPNCNTVVQCTSTGWLTTMGGLCPPPGAPCPTKYGAVPVNQDCTQDNLTCSYPEGVCICTQEFGGATRVTPGWDCFPTQAGCPSPRPELGTLCSQPGLDCNYGGCSGGIEEVCKGGYWQPQLVPCPK
jgi:hypothetical protein